MRAGAISIVYLSAGAHEKTNLDTSLPMFEQRCQETYQATQHGRRQGCRAECSTLKPSSLLSVKAREGEVAVYQGEQMLSPDLFVFETQAGEGVGDVLDIMHGRSRMGN